MAPFAVLAAVAASSGVLKFGSCDATLSFLPEHEIPKDFKRHIEEVSKQQAEQNVSDARHESTGGDAGPSGAAAAATDAPPAAAAGAGAPSGSNTAAAGVPSAPAAADGSAPMDTTPVGGAAGAGAAAAGGAAAGGVVREADVQQLVGLGFSREMAVGALQAANGNVDAAASMLFGM